MNIKKKLIGLFSFAIAVIGLFSGIQSVNAATLNMPDSGWWWQRTNLDDSLHSWHLSLYDFDGRVAYCIEPGVPEGKEYSSGNFDPVSLSNEQKEKIMLIAYYGYDYTGHQTLEYRAATQALIWETVGTSRVYFSSQRWNQGTKYNVDAQRNEIMNLVNKHYVRPSFSGKTYEGKVGEPIVITDSNNVLSEFYVEASNDAKVEINGNTLTITPTKIGKIRLSFKKELYTTREYLVYYSEGKQKMYSSGMVDPVQTYLNIETDGGDVEFNKFDKDTGSSKTSGEATLEGAVYGVYDANTDALISTATTNKEGHAKITKLPYFGDFYLQEITPSKGYELDTTKYSFTSSLDNVDNEIVVYEKVINRDVELTKVYATDKSEIMTPEANVEFGFYNSKGELYKTGKTDNNGKLNINLVYGSYTVKQLTTSKDTTKVDDFKLEIKESGNKYYYTIANSKLTAKLKVIKIDKDTKKVIPRSNIEFKIYDVINKKYITQTITYPTVEVVEKFKTDSKGVLITPYPLEAGTYRLEEVDQKIDGYLWNKESVEFVIGEGSELITDNEAGILFEVKFENKAVKGNIIITKNGEDVELTDNGYTYTKINLSNVKIGLFADEDIYDGTNTLIYKKDTKIGEYITDENGDIKIDNLYLGKYYLQEIETDENHVLDETKYNFELKYKDQYTEKVSYDITIENKYKTGKLEFTKTDFSTSEALPNTLIEIYTENDELVYSGRTDSEGKIVIDRLPIGKYYILEKEAPEGYEINPEKMEFEIKENGEIVKCNMKDNLIVEVPNTNQDSLPLIPIAVSISVIGIGLVIYGKKKNK